MPGIDPRARAGTLKGDNMKDDTLWRLVGIVMIAIVVVFIYVKLEMASDNRTLARQLIVQANRIDEIKIDKIRKTIEMEYRGSAMLLKVLTYEIRNSCK